MLCEGAVNGGSSSVLNMACELCEDSFQDDAHRNAAIQRLESCETLSHAHDKKFARVQACEVSVLFPSERSFVAAKDSLEELFALELHTSFRGGVGPVQWLQLQGKPVFVLCNESCQICSSRWPLNKLMHATCAQYLAVYIVAVPSFSVWLTAADAA